MSLPPDITSSNPFDILGLDRTASFDDVKQAYRRLARQYHPDLNPNEATALEVFAAINKAFERLKTFYELIDQSAPVSAPVSTNAPAPHPLSDELPTATAASGVDETVNRDSKERTPGDGHPLFQKVGSVRFSSELTAKGTGNSIGDRDPSRQTSATPTGAVTGTGVRGTASREGVIHTATLPKPITFGSGPTAARAELVSQAMILGGEEPTMSYALIGMRASDSVVFPRVPLNLCLVLDHSSSMLRGGKVDRLKETVRGIIDQLEEDDILAIVTFGDRAEVLLPAQPLRDKESIYEAIDAIHCRGGTEISRGLTAGLSELGRNASRALSHLILLTDGQTHGDERLCLERAEEAASLNISITAYGLGGDWNNVLLDGIAAPTGGYSDYIESAEEIQEAFSRRVLGLQATTLHKVTLSIRLADDTRLYRATLISPLLRPLQPVDLSGMPVCIVGDMSSNDDYKILLEFVVGSRHEAVVNIANVVVRYGVPGLQRDEETITIPLSANVDPDPDAQLQIDPRIVAALRHQTIHRLQQQAWVELTVTGNLKKGTSLLKRAAEHLELEGHTDLASVTKSEATRIESGGNADDTNVKRIIYGTRRLG